MPRLVEAAVCHGRGIEHPAPGRRRRRMHQMTTEVRVGKAGPEPEWAPPRSSELLTQGGVTEAICLPGKYREKPQSPVQVAAGPGEAGPAQPCVCGPAKPSPALAWGGLGRA